MLSGSVGYDQVIHPEDLSRVQQEVVGVSAEKNRDRFIHKPYRILTPKGDARWIEDRTDIERDEKGNIIRYRGILLDITDRKNAEKALRESEERFRLYVENSQSGVLIIDADQRIEYVNSGMAETVGYPLAEIIGRQFAFFIDDSDKKMVIDHYIRRQKGEDIPSRYEFTSIVQEKIIDIFGLDAELGDFFNRFSACLPEEDRTRFRTSVKDVAETLAPWNYEGQFIKPSGELIWFEGRSLQRKIGDKIAFYGFLADITPRKQIEESLRFTQFSFDKAAISIYYIDSKARISNVNQQAAESLGYTIEELSNMSVFDIDPLVDNTNWRAIWQKLCKGGRDNFETIHRRKDGKEIPVEITSNLLEYNGQQHSIAFVQDITERKRMAEALENRILALTQPLGDVSDIAFEDLFNLTDLQQFQDLYSEVFGVAALITHPDGTPITQTSNFTDLCENIIRKTKKGCEKCNYSDAMIGRHNPDGPNIMACLSAGLWNAGACISVGGRHIANWLIGQVRNDALDEKKIIAYAHEIGADEHDFRTAYLQVPIMSETQFENAAKVLFAVTSQLSLRAYQNVQQARFISQHKLDEEELRKLRNYLSNIINSMPSMLVAVDREGRVTQWNRQTEQVTGLNFKDAQTQPLAKVFPRLANEMENVRTSIQEGRVIKSPKISHKVAQEICYEDITIFPLVANGVEGAVIRVDNVTERVRMEEMMIQSEKMLSVGGLAAGMAHEINNPLAGMLQTAQVLSQRLMAGANIPANLKAAEAAGTTMEAIEQFMENRGIQRMIGAITESGQRVSEIVSNMLSFARKEDPVVSYDYLDKILDKTIALAATDYDLKKEYDFKQIEIIREYDDNLPAVPCQASKIQQVILNILTNGAQAMQDAGTPNAGFIIRTYGDSVKNMACIEIQDNGPGMDEKTRKKIFDPFFTTKPKGVGTGLGLSVSYFIITENHKGKMTVESCPGEGTKFMIQLPL